jgi:hypothetical protein
VRDYPEARLKDRAKHFGVHPSGSVTPSNDIASRLKKPFRYRQRDHWQRQVFRARLRQFLQHHGRDAIIDLDESGFEQEYPTLFAWSLRGQVIYGEHPAKDGPGKPSAPLAILRNAWRR